jgi:ABC-type glycerol-3-phosphate transport system substrate-binding protein
LDRVAAVEEQCHAGRDADRGGTHNARSSRRSCRRARHGTLGARGADMIVWWEQGFYPQADEAIREIIAAFEQQTGKHVDFVFQPPEGMLA